MKYAKRKWMGQQPERTDEKWTKEISWHTDRDYRKSVKYALLNFIFGKLDGMEHWKSRELEDVYNGKVKLFLLSFFLLYLCSLWLLFYRL